MGDLLQELLTRTQVRLALDRLGVDAIPRLLDPDRLGVDAIPRLLDLDLLGLPAAGG